MKLDSRVLAALVVVAAALAFLAGNRSVITHFSSSGSPQYVMTAQHLKPIVIFGMSVLPESVRFEVVSAQGRVLGGKRIWLPPAPGFVQFENAMIRTGNVASFSYDTLRLPVPTTPSGPVSSGNRITVDVPFNPERP